MIQYEYHKYSCSFFHNLVSIRKLQTKPFAQVKENNGNGPPKFCIDLEADWLIILDEVRGKSPGHYELYLACTKAYYLFLDNFHKFSK